MRHEVSKHCSVVTQIKKRAQRDRISVESDRVTSTEERDSIIYRFRRRDHIDVTIHVAKNDSSS